MTEASQAPGILTVAMEMMLWMKEYCDFPYALKYPLKQN
jgi:hypothetical protein